MAAFLFGEKMMMNKNEFITDCILNRGMDLAEAARAWAAYRRKKMEKK